MSPPRHTYIAQQTLRTTTTTNPTCLNMLEVVSCRCWRHLLLQHDVRDSVVSVVRDRHVRLLVCSRCKGVSASWHSKPPRSRAAPTHHKSELLGERLGLSAELQRQRTGGFRHCQLRHWRDRHERTRASRARAALLDESDLREEHAVALEGLECRLLGRPAEGSAASRDRNGERQMERVPSDRRRAPKAPTDREARKLGRASRGLP